MGRTDCGNALSNTRKKNTLPLYKGSIFKLVAIAVFRKNAAACLCRIYLLRPEAVERNQCFRRNCIDHQAQIPWLCVAAKATEIVRNLQERKQVLKLLI